MSQLSYSEALEHLEKNNIKITKSIKKALDELYPSGHELVYIDEIEKTTAEKYSINLYGKDNNFIAQYPNLEFLEVAINNVFYFQIYFNEICECNHYKYNKGYTSKDIKEIRIVKEEE